MTTLHDPSHAGRVPALAEQFTGGLAAPICLTWEWTYACNLSCAHCLSSSGRRDPRELSTAEIEAVIDELERMRVFYVNVGGGEPTVRPDFWDLLDYAIDHRVGVKFSTNGVRLSPERARRLATTDYVDVQVSLDGATRDVNDAVRGPGAYDMAVRAMENLAAAGFSGFKISVVMTRRNVAQLDAFAAIADRYGAQLRITRLRPSGRGADVWDELHPTAAQQREIYAWLLDHGDRVLTGDSFFHLNALGPAPLPGLNLCGAGRVVCLIDPVGDVYACPFAIHDAFRAGNVRSPGGFERVWRESSLFAELRRPSSGGACAHCSAYDACRGGCMAAKFFTGLPLDGPDPECVKGHGEAALRSVDPAALPRQGNDHSRPTVALGMPAVRAARPDRFCDESPLAGMDPAHPMGGRS
ncbi:mycofactocin radical SAM maturase [Actinomadura miaoliensis]|uniref:Mycofactocin radical SAM maturase n=1 Tax=Actinomadura miaoliensis TaxID=430685 RepID=A0ABP7V114_9ACTN